MAFSNYEWIAEYFAKIDDIGKRLEAIEAKVAEITAAIEQMRSGK